jgi:hypothetical protein
VADARGKVAGKRGVNEEAVVAIRVVPLFCFVLFWFGLVCFVLVWFGFGGG